MVTNLAELFNLVRLQLRAAASVILYSLLWFSERRRLNGAKVKNVSTLYFMDVSTAYGLVVRFGLLWVHNGPHKVPKCRTR